MFPISLGVVLMQLSYTDLLTQIIALLSGPGFAILISQFLETIPAWHDIPNKTVKYIASIAFTAIGSIAGYFLASSPEVAALPQNNPQLATILVIVALALAQVYHVLTKQESSEE